MGLFDCGDMYSGIRDPLCGHGPNAIDERIVG